MIIQYILVMTLQEKWNTHLILKSMLSTASEQRLLKNKLMTVIKNKKTKKKTKKKKTKQKQKQKTKQKKKTKQKTKAKKKKTYYKAFSKLPTHALFAICLLAISPS